MNLLLSFQQFIQQENLFSAKDRLLLAVSGGIDSVVLCELCQQAGYDFVIAHCNFQLRGEESDSDELFVKELGKQYGKQVLVKKFDTRAYATQHKVSIQVAARELRYAWFDELLGRDITHQPSAISHLLTAHHLNDNIETMLMNFFKGTGIAGLRGILPKQGKVLRPLLFAKKETLQQFAADNGLQWREDSSNQLDKYARNYFRNQLIPLVKNVYPEAENNLAGNLQRFKDIELLYHQAVYQHKKKLLEYKGNEVHIPVLKLQQTRPLHSVLYEIIKAYHFSPDQVPEVMALMASETGKYIQSASHRIIKNRHWLIISPQQDGASATIIIEATDKKMAYPQGFLTFSTIPHSSFPIPDSPHTACLDAGSIQFPLLLRKWKTGDYFYPLGMPKKKKLSRFFIDLKLSKTDKEKIWVLEMNKKIVWVVGYRIDNRFKITPSTQQVLQIQSKALDI